MSWNIKTPGDYINGPLTVAGSATITGDLTVRTNKLIVTNTGVGVGMTPITPLSGVIGTTGAVLFRTTDPAAPVATPYIQAPVSTGFSSVSPAYGFWYQACGIGNPALNNVSIITDSAERYKIDITGVSTWSVAGTTAMTLNSTGLGIGVTPANNKLQVLGNIGLPNSCTASNETSGVFSIDVANLYAAAGAVWRQCSFLLVYSGVDQNLGNSTVLQTIVTLQGLSTWNTISKNDIVGTASVAVSNDTTTGARITVTVPTGNLGSAYVMLIGGMTSTRPSITINP